MSLPPRNPVPAYEAEGNPFLHADRDLYTKIGESKTRSLVESFILPIRSGRAWTVPKGHLCRLSTPEGPQVGDLNIWNLHNPRERFWASRTRQLHQSHVSKFDRLWSCLPYLRPMVTITGDSLEGYHDEVGGRVHDVSAMLALSKLIRRNPISLVGENRPSRDLLCLLASSCSALGVIHMVLDTLRPRKMESNVDMDTVNQLIAGEGFDFHCHSNLTRAILPYGLTESDVHDVLNVFQVTGLDKNGRYFMEPCPARPGDYFEFFAEIDILCALSTCPGGDLSTWGWGDGAQRGRDMVDCCRPLGVEVYALGADTLEGWQSPEPARYKGMHGIGMPTFRR